MSSPAELRQRPWADASRPLSDRVDALLGVMTIEEKVAQLSSVWIGGTVAADNVAPQQSAFARDRPFDEATHHGLGQLTRVFGTAPVKPGDGMRTLAELQSELVGRTRFGIPAIAHEECLTGFTTLRRDGLPDAAGLGRDVRRRARSRRWRRGSARACARSGSTRASRPCSTSCATTAGAASRRRSARTRTSSERSAPRTSAASRRPGSSRRSSTSPATRRRERVATSGPCPSARASSGDVLPAAVRDAPCATAPARSCTPTARSTASRPPPTRGCSPTCCATSGASTASWWRTTSASRSCRRCTASPARRRRRARRRWPPASTSSCPTAAAIAAARRTRSHAGELAEELVDRAVRRVLRQKAELGLLDADWAPDDEPARRSSSTRPRTARSPARSPSAR